MKNINIAVAGKVATVIGSPIIVCGNADYVVTFTLDDEWAAETVKTARFVYHEGGVYKYTDVEFEGNQVDIPVLVKVDAVYVGLYTANYHTTTSARVPCKRSILCKADIQSEYDRGWQSGVDAARSRFYNHAKLNQLYVKDGVLVCNDNSSSCTQSHTAKYAGVNLGQPIQRAEIRFGFTGDTSYVDDNGKKATASIMLISTGLGCSQTAHITKGSCHFGVSPHTLTMEFYDTSGSKVSGFSYSFPQPLPPDTTHTFRWEVIRDNTDSTKTMLRVYCPKRDAETGEFATGLLGTFKEGTALWDNFVVYNGPNLILEHFYEATSKVRGYYVSAFAEANDDFEEYMTNRGAKTLAPNSEYFRHDFGHQSFDGPLTVAPTGQIYTLFSNEVNIGSALDLSGVDEED